MISEFLLKLTALHCLLFLAKASDFSNHGLYWSGSLPSPASISTEGTWQNIENANVLVSMGITRSALVSYDLEIEGLRLLQNSIVPRESNVDIIQIRCVVDGIPYRYSSSYGSTYMVEERLYTRTASSFVVDFSDGNHTVALQWKKSGTQIAEWVIASGGVDSGYSLSVQADFKYLWHTHELSDQLISQQSVWKPVTNNLSFHLAQDSMITMGYSMVVQPQLAAFIKDRSMEFISANLKIDGISYTEGSSTHGSNPWNPTAATLTGVVSLQLEAGSHTVQLQWRKLGAIFKSWGSNPSYLDGFSTSRNVYVSVSKFSSPTALSYKKQFSKSDGQWTTVGNSIQTFDLVKESALFITYALPVTQHENPNFDGNVWEHLSSVSTRLVVDGVAYVHEGGRTVSAGSRIVKELFGDLGLVLPAGSHTVSLQWKSDGFEWMTLNDLEDGFSHGERLLTYISSENSRPTITAPSSVNGFEDTPFHVEGVSVDDVDAQLEPGMMVNLNITVSTGALTFLDTPLLALDITYIHGLDSTMIIMTDTIANINAALANMLYTPPSLWNGADMLTLDISDIQNIGFSSDGSVQTATKNIVVTVLPVDNSFTLSLPTVQAGLLAMETTQLDPIVLFDTDSQTSVFRVNLAVACGVLSLNESVLMSATDLVFFVGDGANDAAMDFKGTYSSIVSSLMSLSFKPDDSCNSGVHGEFLYVRVINTENIYHDIAGYVPLEVVRENIVPRVVSDNFPRWKIEGFSIAKSGLVNYTQYPIYVSTSMDTEVSNVVVENFNESSSMSELSVIETENGLYALSVQFEQATVIMTSSSYILSGVSKYVTLQLSNTTVLSEAEEFECILGDFSVQATILDNRTLGCNVVHTVSGAISSESKAVWLSVVYRNGSQSYRTNFVPLYISEPPTLESLSTYGSFADSRSIVTLKVGGVNTIDRCFVHTPVGSTYSIDAVAHGTQVVKCRLPVFSTDDVAAGSAVVHVGSADEYFMSSGLLLTLYSKPTITSVDVHTDYTHSGNALLVVGGNWSIAAVEYVSNVQCKINGDIQLTVLLYERSSVSCIMNADSLLQLYYSNSSADVRVQLLFDNQATNEYDAGAEIFIAAYEAALHLAEPSLLDSAKDQLEVRYTPVSDSSAPIVLTAVSPTSGSSVGGETVIISGSGFDILSDFFCKFDTFYSRAMFSTANSTLSCTTPPHYEGVAKLSVVADNFATSEDMALDFTYTGGHEVYAVTPSAALLSGGNQIVVSGVGFNTGAADSAVCQFGATSSPATIVSDTTISCITPASDTIGPVSFSVVLASGSSAGSVIFRFISPVAISGCYPASGESSGGNNVYIYGLAFVPTASTTCLFGSVSVPARVINSTTTECIAPASAGQRTVTVGLVIEGYTFEADETVEYTFVPSQYVSAVEPSSGFTTGNTSLTVLGSGYEESANFVCVIDETFVPGLFINETAIGCITVAHTAGTVSFRLVVDGIEARNLFSALTYSYVAPITVSSVFPTVSSTAGGSMVVVSGTGFSLGEGSGSLFTCQFGGESSPAVAQSDSKLSCLTPSITKAQSVVLKILIENELALSVGMFRFVEEAIVLSVSPSTGSVKGGNSVILQGLSFVPSAVGQCTFGTEMTTARVINTTSVECTAPPAVDKHSSEVVVGLTLDGYTAESSVSYTYINEVVVTNISPEMGFTSGDTEVTVRGSGFRYGVKYSCWFGDLSTQATVESTAELICASAPRAAGAVNFRVTAESAELQGSSSSFVYTYLPLFSLSSASPQSGPLSGGAAVSVRGTGFSSIPEGAIVQCMFGTQSVEGALKSDTEILCSSPKTLSKSTVPLSIAVGSESVASSLVFHFAEAVEVFAVHPACGSVKGGNAVIILGTGFAPYNNAQCMFGSLNAPARILNSSAIECVVPEYFVEEEEVLSDDAQGTKTVDVSVVLDGVTSSLTATKSTQVLYSYISAISITALSPSFGSTRGGTHMIISGTGFRYDMGLSCIIGDSFNPAVFVSETALLCLTPAHMAGVVDVSLSINGALSEQLVEPLKFIFVSPPVVSSSSPTGGSELGGTVVTVYGSGFRPAGTNAQYERVSCMFGGEAVDAVVINNTVANCISPAYTGGSTVELTVMTNGDVASGSSEFAYAKPSVITQCEPSYGSVVGGTVVMCYGLSLASSASAECMFGNISTPARVVSSTLVECLSPPREGTDSVSISIHIDGYSVDSDSLDFTYVDTMSLYSIEPAVGPSQGGTTVQVTGIGFSTSAGNLYCMFGDKLSAATIESDTLLTCESVAHITGNAAFSVYGHNVEAIASKPLYFEYQSSLHVTSISPAAGSIVGGELLTVLGSGFSSQRNSGALMMCNFGADKQSPATVVGDGLLSCISPASDASGVLLFSVSLKHVTSTGSVYYRYLEPVVISSCYPESGDTMGGNNVLVSGLSFVPSASTVCLFGNAESPARVLSSTAVECVAPPAIEGHVSVMLGLSIDGYSQMSDITYRYVNEIVIAELIPPFASTQGHTNVTVTGSGFSFASDLLCQIGDSRTSAVYVSSSEIVCNTPGHAAGTVQLSIVPSMSGAHSNSLELTFTNKPTVYEVRTGTAHLVAGADVRVTGVGFSNEFINQTSFVCTFWGGETSIPVTVLSDSLLTCTCPPRESDSDSNFAVVEVQLEGERLFQKSFLSVSSALYTGAAFPASAMVKVNTAVRVFGGPFYMDLSYSCSFGDDADVPEAYSAALMLSASELLCFTTDSILTSMETYMTVSEELLGNIYHIPFSFVMQPTIENVQFTGDSTFGLRVSLSGVSVNSSQLSCRLNDISYGSVSVSETELLCGVPIHALLESTADSALLIVESTDSFVQSHVYDLVISDMTMSSSDSLANNDNPTGAASGSVLHCAQYSGVLTYRNTFGAASPFSITCPTGNTSSATATGLSLDEKRILDFRQWFGKLSGTPSKTLLDSTSAFDYTSVPTPNTERSSMSSSSPYFSMASGMQRRNTASCTINKQSCFNTVDGSVANELDIASADIASSTASGYSTSMQSSSQYLIIDAVSPTILSLYNDTWVLVNGRSFSNYTQCRINNATALDTIVMSSTVLQCKVSSGLGAFHTFRLTLDLVDYLSTSVNSVSVMFAEINPSLSAIGAAEFTSASGDEEADMTTSNSDGSDEFCASGSSNDCMKFREQIEVNLMQHSACNTSETSTWASFRDITTFGRGSNISFCQLQDNLLAIRKKLISEQLAAPSANAEIAATVSSTRKIVMSVPRSMNVDIAESERFVYFIGAIEGDAGSTVAPYENWCMKYSLVPDSLHTAASASEGVSQCEVLVDGSSAIACSIPISLVPGYVEVGLLWMCNEPSIYISTVLAYLPLSSAEKQEQLSVNERDLSVVGLNNFTATASGSRKITQVQVSNIAPVGGALHGGTTITITGSDVSDISACVFTVTSGVSYTTPVTGIAAEGGETTQCITPTVNKAGSAHIDVVSVSARKTLQTGFFFEFYDAPDITYASLVDDFNNTLVISGTNFPPFARSICKVVSSNISGMSRSSYFPGHMISESAINCIGLQESHLHAVGTSNLLNEVFLTFNGLEYLSVPLLRTANLIVNQLASDVMLFNKTTTTSEQLVFTSPNRFDAIVLDFSSQFSSADAITHTTVCDQPFLVPVELPHSTAQTDSVTCVLYTMGSTLEVSGRYVSSSAVVCSLPSSPPGIYDLAVYKERADPQQSSMAASVHLRCVNQAKIMSGRMTPQSLFDGSTDIVFSGINFDRNAEYRLMFGTHRAAGTVHSTNVLSFTVPALLPGLVDVHVSMEGSTVVLFSADSLCVSAFVLAEGSTLTEMHSTAESCSTVNLMQTVQSVAANAAERVVTATKNAQINRTLAIRSQSPHSGLSIGSTAVEIIADGFVSSFSTELKCRFGPIMVDAIVMNFDRILCYTPVLNPQNVSVSVISSNGNSWCCGWFAFYPVMKISQVSPTVISSRGGSIARVTMHTELPMDMHLFCHFDNSIAVPAHVISSKELSCVTPSTSSSAVTLSIGSELEAWSDSISILTSGYTTLTSLIPFRGSRSGGTSIGISVPSSLAAFSKPMCLFGEWSADHTTYSTSPAVVVNGGEVVDNQLSAQMTCTTPPALAAVSSAVNKVPVYIVDAATSAPNDITIFSPVSSFYIGTFTYEYPAEVTSISPSVVTHDKSAELMVFGVNFIDSSTLSCVINNKTFVPAKWFAQSLVSCTVPVSTVLQASQTSSGVVYIQVSNNGADISASSASLTVIADIFVRSVNPKVGFVLTETAVELQLLRPHFGRLDCRFGGAHITPAFQVEPTRFVCMSPPLSVAGDTHLEVIDSSQSVLASSTFTYTPVPVVVSEQEEGVAVATVLADVESTFSVFSTGFAESTSARFVTTTGAILPIGLCSLVSNSEIQCTVKAGPTEEFVFLELSVNDKDYLKNFALIQVFTPSTVVSVDPLYVSFRGGNSLSFLVDSKRSGSATFCRFSTGRNVPRTVVANVVATVTNRDNDGVVAGTGGVEAECIAPALPLDVPTYFSIVQARDVVIYGPKQMTVLREPTITAVSPSVVLSGVPTTLILSFNEAQYAFPARECVFQGETYDFTLINSLSGLCVVHPFFLSSNGDNTTATAATNVSSLRLQYKSVPSSAVVAGEHISVVDTNSAGYQIDKTAVLAYSSSKLTITSDTCSIPQQAACKVTSFVSQISISTEVASDFCSLTCLVDLTSALDLPEDNQIRLDLCVSPHIHSCGLPLFSQLVSVVPGMVVTALRPAKGAAAGGGIITVYGAAFVADSSLFCQFGEHGRSSLAVVSSTNKLWCELPPGVPGNVSVLLTRQGINVLHSSSIVPNFEYMPLLTTVVVNASRISSLGGTTVHCGVQDLSSQGPYSCRFQDIFVPAVIINKATLLCVSPMSDFPNVSFALAVDGADVSTEQYLRVVKPPTVMFIDPTIMSAASPANVSVIFDSFDDDVAEVQCFFNDIRKPSSFDGAVYTCCVACQANGLGPLPVGSHELKLMSDGAEFFKIPVTARSPFQIQSIQPLVSFASVSTAVTMRSAQIMSDGLIHSKCCFGEELKTPAMHISASEIQCFTPRVSIPVGSSIVTMPVGLANADGVCEFYGFDFNFYAIPKAIGSEGNSGTAAGGTSVLMHFASDLPFESVYCRIGYSITVGQILNNRSILCVTTGTQRRVISTQERRLQTSTASGLVLQPSPIGNVPIEISSNGIDFSSTGQEFTFLPVTRTDPDAAATTAAGADGSGSTETDGATTEPEVITNVFAINLFDNWPTEPAFGDRNVQTSIVAYGHNLNMTDPDSLTNDFLVAYCLVGEDYSYAVVIDSRTVGCLATTSTFSGKVPVKLTDKNKAPIPGTAYFEFINDPVIFSAEPSIGSAGADLLMYGTGFRRQLSLVCVMGDRQVDTFVVSDDVVLCRVPELAPGDYSVSLQTNGQHFVRSGVHFEYRAQTVLERLWPLNGPALRGATVVSIYGSNFVDSVNVYCVFDTTYAPAVVLSSELIQCKLPPHRPGMVNVSLVADGALLHPLDTALQFLYVADVSVDKITPQFGYTSGEFPVFILGSNFLNTSSLGCQFADMKTRGIFLSNTSMICLAPSPLGRPELKLSQVAVEVTVNGLDYSASNILFSYSEPCDKGFFCPGMTRQLCPNGTYCPENSRNFSICEPGFFQPKEGQIECVLCPVGYICPDHGMSRPVNCPPGLICDSMGLRSSVKLCPMGQYCLNGTKASSISLFEGSATNSWLTDYVTGVVSFNMSTYDWNYKEWPAPAVGKSRPLHPPEESCDGLVCFPGSTNILAEAPFPCPIGHYCRAGVGTQIPMPKNFSSPQRCFDGYFCPRGSVSPEGSGPCPNGYFCPTQLDALLCPQGHYCPGVGNRAPIECYPGTFNPFEGQANCTVCPTGFICPGWGVLLPEPCPAGFVCMALGLSYPVVLCPQGYYCPEGTLTIDPSASTPLKPYSCSGGEFCLGGVAANTETVEWIPSQPYGSTFAQDCSEGTYCEDGAYLSSGSGLCFRGHYCPPKTDFPTKTPRGNFASGLGSVAPTLCYPGTYASLQAQVDCAPCPSGHTCVSYGTYKPTICPVGTYRSQVDSVTCSQCQVGTYSYEVGAPDLSLCLPCPKGRICGTKALSTLKLSSECPAGYVCGYGTDRGAQFNHLTPAGFHTASEMIPEEQYDYICAAGYYCLRGTPTFNALGGKCPVGSFCPESTPAAISADTKCPQTTTSLSGSSTLQSCRISPQDVCDKNIIDDTDPMQYVTYYPTFEYDLLDDSNLRLTFDSSQSANNPTGEILVVKKIDPMNLTSSSPPWVNETIEALRSCPLYGSGVGGDVITVIGRNFRDTKLNYCKFRACYVANLGRHPRRCANQITAPTGEDLPAVGNVSEASFITRAKYVSDTRMECTVPEFLFQALNEFTPPAIAEYECLYVDHFGVLRNESAGILGNFSYVRECDDPTVCVNQPTDGHEWFASLIFPCTETEIYEETCADKPEPGYMFNPCMSAEVLVEVTNDGEHYSGGYELTGTSILSTTRYLEGGDIYKNFKNFTIKATFAVYTYVYPEYFYANPAIMDMERQYCAIARYSEEAVRERETYWYPLQLNNVAHVQLDFSHLPSNLVYDQHYKIAIFVLPSRCTVELCSDARVRLSPEEFLPCRKPVELSYWFQQTNVPKNVKNNITVYALDDVIIKVEVHLLHGLYRAYAPLFKNTTTIRLAKPERSKAFTGLKLGKTSTRRLSEYISYEQRLIPRDFFFCAVVYLEDTTVISQALNMPPLYSAYERGRVLIMNNVSADNEVVPLVLDNIEDVNAGTQFWQMPATTSDESKELLDAYFETFHKTTYDTLNGYVFDFDTMLLPYLPYFSNCNTFDSYIPIWLLLEGKECELPDFYPQNWYRYKFDPLPDQDFISFVGPFDFFEYPVADWCERDVYCNYEEDLTGVDNTPRWFEATGGSLFTVIRLPLSYKEYTGRSGTFISQDDAGGALAVETLQAESGDNFIPLNIDHSLGDFPGCDVGFQCMARLYTLSIAYYQVDNYEKKIIWMTLAGDLYDFDQEDTSYQLHLSFFALGFLDLIITFAFPIIIFMLIFFFLGFLAIFMAFIGWLMCRITTSLQNPPQMKFFGTLKLILPPPAAGVSIALILIMFMTAAGNYFVNGFFYTDPNSPERAEFGTLMLDQYQLLYADIGSVISTDEYERARAGRIGSVFAIVGTCCLYTGVKMYFPKEETKRDRELAKKRTPLAEKRDVWDPIKWRKNNFLFSSFVFAIFCVLVVELSFWTFFGDYIYVIIVMLLILAEFVSAAVEFQLREQSLCAPLLATYEFIQQLVTFGSPDFLAFLLAYFLGAAVSMFQRVFQKFYLDAIFGVLSSIFNYVVAFVRKLIPKYLTKTKNAQEAADIKAAAETIAAGKKRQLEDLQEAQESESVEPILEYFTDVSSDTAILFYYPFFVYILMQFRNEIQIPIIYEIKQSDMMIYLVFQCFMLFAEPLVDVFNHSQCELFHGWKIYEYLVYSRYRYLQRETRWKGMENSLDECIDESLRTIDQMCFSSQYFLMLTIHMNGIIFLVLAMECWLFVNYSPFSDSGFFLLLGFLVGVYLVLEWFVMFFAKTFKVWKIKHENTAWHLQQKDDDELDLPGWEEVKGASSDAYLMNQRITSDTFRNKFLNYNRTWLINQLPQILTPRTMRRSRPYLINQFARIINAKRDDISDDSEEEDKDKKFGPVALSAASRNIVRWWLGKAKRRIRLRNIVEPLIKRARGSQCEMCLSRKQLQVEYEIDVDTMADMYDNAYPGDEEVDQIQWKQFWMNNQRYHTICLACLTKRKEVDARNAAKGNYDPSIFDDGQEDYPDWGPVFLTAASKAMLLNWYRKAQRLRAGKRGARKKEKKVKAISDDEGEDAGHRWLKDLPPLTPASQGIAIFWMRTARARLQKKHGKGNGLREKELQAKQEAAEMLTDTFRSGNKSRVLKK